MYLSLNFPQEIRFLPDEGDGDRNIFDIISHAMSID